MLLWDVIGHVIQYCHCPPCFSSFLASFISFVVDTPIISGPPSSALTLTCSVTYMTSQRLGISMPLIRWDTDLDHVDISDQTVLSSGESAYSNLTLSNVNSSYCGIYTCSAMDRFTGLPSTGSATAIVNTGKVLWFILP